MVGASIIGVQKITNSTAVRNSEIFSVGKKLEYRKSFQQFNHSIIYTLIYYPYKSKTFFLIVKTSAVFQLSLFPKISN